ncbi:threonine dehydratase [Agaribacter flavus]|uniref:Threonine dehydratase n=1 Tax=Agaribacter flavus TaxID=1902781 RepID=A0ABV7FT37_9ALTE
MFNLSDINHAADVIYQIMPPTPQYNWPQLSKQMDCDVWVKHENHTPTGAFKVRGGIYLMNQLEQRAVRPTGILSATRGNHGQSLSFAGQKTGIPVTIVVPEGNSNDQNTAIKGFGANLVIHGRDFEAARQYSATLLKSSGYQLIAPFAPELVIGVATYALEFLQAVKDLDLVYVPIGMGSGICGLIKTRDLLGIKTEIIGVVAEGAPAFSKSFNAGEIILDQEADTLADGVATRTPLPEAFEIIKGGASRVITVTEQQITQAMYLYFKTTHNLSEGAGAVSLAGLIAEQAKMKGKRVGVVLSGGNIDFARFSKYISPYLSGDLMASVGASVA